MTLLIILWIISGIVGVFIIIKLEMAEENEDFTIRDLLITIFIGSILGIVAFILGVFRLIIFLFEKVGDMKISKKILNKKIF